MALKRLAIEGYGQIELNNVAFRRDGRIEAQCRLSDEFAYVNDRNVLDDPTKPCAENGMLLAIDNTQRIVKFPVDDDTSHLIALNYTTEHMYDERALGLKNFRLPGGTFLPRLGYLAIGDKFTTNCLAFDDEEFADDAALKDAAKNKVALYAKPCSMGAIQITKEKPADDIALQVIYGRHSNTMPDGQFGLQLQAIGV